MRLPNVFQAWKQRGGRVIIPAGIALMSTIVLGVGWSIRSASASPSPVPEASADTVLRSLREMESRLNHLEGRLGLAQKPRGQGGLKDRYAALVDREAALAVRADSALRFVPSINPVEGSSISSAYSRARFHPVLKRVRAHHGLDLAAPIGTPVRAMAAGRVKKRFRTSDYGLGVDVVHGESGYVTRYAHLSSIEVPKDGFVEKGQMIGKVGQTGLTTGPSLHVEVFFGGYARDPALFMPDDTDVVLPE